MFQNWLIKVGFFTKLIVLGWIFLRNISFSKIAQGMFKKKIKLRKTIWTTQYVLFDKKYMQYHNNQIEDKNFTYKASFS